jgi:hypothetical protein
MGVAGEGIAKEGVAAGVRFGNGLADAAHAARDRPGQTHQQG